MANISFANGIKTYNFNGGEKEVAICLTDFNIEKRLEESKELFQKMIEKYEKENNDDVINELDKETRNIIDYIFNAPVSECAFGGLNTWTLDKGLPIWINFLEVMKSEFSKNVSKGFDKFNANMNKYLKK